MNSALVRFAGDVPADVIVRNPEFKCYLQLYCQGVRQGCSSAVHIGIRGSDLAYPRVTLDDGTAYSHIYLVSCSGKVMNTSAGTAILQNINMACPPSPTCADKHRSINTELRCQLRYGMV